MIAKRRIGARRGRTVALAASVLVQMACAGLPSVPPERGLDAILEDESARVMWVGAHPDDESLAGSILARACVGLGRPCAFVVMNRGDGGECLLPEGCAPDLGTVRSGEMRCVAQGFGAELHHFRYYNAPLPVSSFPPRHEIGARWMEAGDPAARVERLIRTFRPTVLLTFDPNNGFTGHPEHQLASRFATEAVRRAAEGPDAHRVSHVYHVLNRYWFWVTGRDPCCPTEAFDTHVSCGAPGVACLDVALAITRCHRTQEGDMGRVRSVRPQIGLLYLREIDPFDTGVAPPPLEPVKAD